MEVLMLTLQKIINAREGCVPTKKADLKRGSDLKRCAHDSIKKDMLFFSCGVFHLRICLLRWMKTIIAKVRKGLNTFQSIHLRQLMAYPSLLLKDRCPESPISHVSRCAMKENRVDWQLLERLWPKLGLEVHRFPKKITSKHQSMDPSWAPTS